MGEEVKVQGLECNASAGVFETNRQDATVDLVKLHQLQQICKQCDTIVHSVVLSVALLQLQRYRGKTHQDENVSCMQLQFQLSGTGIKTYGNDEVVFRLQFITQA